MFDYHSDLKLCTGNLSTNTAFDSSDDAASHISLHVWVDECGFETKNPRSEQASKLSFGKTYKKLVKSTMVALSIQLTGSDAPSGSMRE
jgi:hypothetical protein